MKGITVAIHGESKAGKSWLADTVPGPRLILDAEGKSDWTPSNKVQWNPREPVPELGPDDSAVVTVLDIPTMELVIQWLASGSHPFKSVVLDSLSEYQERVKRTLLGVFDDPRKMYDQLLIKVSDVVCALKDMKKHPTNPLAAVVFICASQPKDDRVRPLLQGQIQLKLPYYVDLVGYLLVGADPETRELRRYLIIQPVPPYVAGDNTDILSKTFGTNIPDPTFDLILGALNAA